jgi:hypothetical protein
MLLFYKGYSINYCFGSTIKDETEFIALFLSSQEYERGMGGGGGMLLGADWIAAVFVRQLLSKGSPVVNIVAIPNSRVCFATHYCTNGLCNARPLQTPV